MTLDMVMQEIDRVQPNTLDGDTKLRYLRQLEKEIYQTVILTHEGWEDVEEPGTLGEHMDWEMIVPDAFASIYLHWLQSRIDYELGEFGRYNNSNAAFEADRIAYTNWYNRTHMPLSAGVTYK